MKLRVIGHLIFRKGFLKTQASPSPLKSAAKICININGFAFFRLLRPTKDLGGQALERESLFFFSFFFFSFLILKTGPFLLERCKTQSKSWYILNIILGVAASEHGRFGVCRFPCLKTSQAICGSLLSFLRALICAGSLCSQTCGQMRFYFDRGFNQTVGLAGKHGVVNIETPIHSD